MVPAYGTTRLLICPPDGTAVAKLVLAGGHIGDILPTLPADGAGPVGCPIHGPGLCGGLGELRSGSCSPHRYCSRQKVLRTAKERERPRSLVVPWAGSCDVLVPQQQTLPVPVPTSHCRGHVLHHSPLLLQVHPVWPQLPEAGRAGETLVILWGGHQELLRAAPQHNSSNSLTAPSLAAMLNGSPGTSARWPLPEPKSVQRGLVRSQSFPLLTSQPLGW